MYSQELVSVVIPAYNIESRIGSCIESALRQTYKNIEIVAINDGSTDHTLEILESFLSDNRVKVFSQTNKGVSSARNHGIRMCNGKWITFLDSDDTLERDCIEKMVDTASDETDIVVCGRKDNLGKGKTLFGGREVYVGNDGIGDFMLKRVADTQLCLWGPWGKLFPKRLLDENLLFFDESISIGEDTLFVLECYERAEKIKCINEQLYNVWKREGSLSSVGVAGVNALSPSLEILKRKIEIFQKRGIYEKKPKVNQRMCDSFKTVVLNLIYTNECKTNEIKESIRTFMNNSYVELAVHNYAPSDWKERIICFLVKNKLVMVSSGMIIALRVFVKVKNKRRRF